jgi:hypothetical protein
MIARTKKLTETKERPRVVEWPVQIEQLPLIPAEALPLDVRVRRLGADARCFRDFLEARRDGIVGFTHDGTRCPLATWLKAELELVGASAIYVSASSVGIHDCTRLNCDQHLHVEHEFWAREFVRRIDTGMAHRAVRGSEALAVLDAVLHASPRLRRRPHV